MNILICAMLLTSTQYEKLGLTREIILKDYAHILSKCVRLENIGAGKPYSVSRMRFSELLEKKPDTLVSSKKLEQKTTAITFTGDKGISVEFYGDGNIYWYRQGFGYPQRKMPELPDTLLTQCMREAVLVANHQIKDVIVSREPFPYGGGEISLLDPYAAYGINPVTNGIKWGPGEWGRGGLLNHTGQIYMLRLGPIFSKVEPTANAMSEGNALSFAASSVLREEKVSQTNLIQSMGKIITGNPFLGGSYYKKTARTRAISEQNLGVVAYHFQMGNGGFTSSGKPAIAYEIIIDGKTGETLSLGTYASLGGQRASFDIPITVKKTYKSFRIQGLKGTREYKNVSLLLSDNTSEAEKWKDVCVKGDGIFFKAKSDGKSLLRVGEKTYKIKT
jgi:hypothetical protein